MPEKISKKEKAPNFTSFNIIIFLFHFVVFTEMNFSVQHVF